MPISSLKVIFLTFAGNSLRIRNKSIPSITGVSRLEGALDITWESFVLSKCEQDKDELLLKRTLVFYQCQFSVVKQGIRCFQINYAPSSFL